MALRRKLFDGVGMSFYNDLLIPRGGSRGCGDPAASRIIPIIQAKARAVSDLTSQANDAFGRCQPFEEA